MVNCREHAGTTRRKTSRVQAFRKPCTSKHCISFPCGFRAHLQELELHDLSNSFFRREPTAHVRTRQEAPQPLSFTVSTTKGNTHKALGEYFGNDLQFRRANMLAKERGESPEARGKLRAAWRIVVKQHCATHLDKHNGATAVDSDDRALEHHVFGLHFFHLRPRLLVLDSADRNLDLYKKASQTIHCSARTTELSRVILAYAACACVFTSALKPRRGNVPTYGTRSKTMLNARRRVTRRDPRCACVL